MLGQNISLTSMDNIPILAFDRGTARICVGRNYYIHRFRISDLQNVVQSLESEFNKVEDTQYTKIISEEFKAIAGLLKSIIPQRKKRWDAVGTVWKFIAGSPDANDLKVYVSNYG